MHYRRRVILVVMRAMAGCSEAEPPARLTIPGADPARGKALIAEYGCGACHFVEGVRGADGIVAPRLEDFANRTLLAGTFPNVPRLLVPWLKNPLALKPDTAMPDLGVSDGEARDIASYLYTLGASEAAPPAEAAVTDVSGQAFEVLRSLQKERLHGIDKAMKRLAAGTGS